MKKIIRYIKKLFKKEYPIPTMGAFIKHESLNNGDWTHIVFAGGNVYINGESATYLDELMIFNRALSGNEVKQIYKELLK